MTVTQVWPVCHHCLEQPWAAGDYSCPWAQPPSGPRPQCSARQCGRPTPTAFLPCSNSHAVPTGLVTFRQLTFISGKAGKERSAFYYTNIYVWILYYERELIL